MTLALLSLIYFYLDLLLVLLIVVQIWTLEDLLMTLALPYLVILGNVNVISELDKNIFVETQFQECLLFSDKKALPHHQCLYLLTYVSQ